MKKNLTIGLALAVILALVTSVAALASGTPTIASDLPDYAPGSTVTLTGTSWNPGETVKIFVNDDDFQTWSLTDSVVAGIDGSLTYQFQLPNSFIAKYYVTATALSGTATTSFTDMNAASASGTVTDAVTGLPIYQASVSCTDGCNAVISQATNSAGYYVFDATTTKLSFAGGAHGPTSLTLTASKAGYLSATRTLSPLDNGSTFSNIDFALIPSDTTAPTASPSASPAANGAGWNNSDVTVTWNWADNVGGTGIDEANCTDSSTSTGEGEIKLTATCNDLAGNEGSASYTVYVDKTKPVITFDSRTAANSYGWNNSDVTVTWSCTDALSGAVADSVSTKVSTEGANQSATGTCTDLAGNTASDEQTDINIDKTAPTGVTGAPGRVPDHNGWYNHPVDVVFTGTDLLSGIANCDAPNYKGPDGTGLTVLGACVDKAGNESPEVSSSAFDYDATAPTGVTGAPNRLPDHNGWYNHAVDVVFTGTDATSDIDTCTTVTYSTPDGEDVTVNGSCTDKAGNTSASVASSAFDYDATAPAPNLVGAPSNSWGICGGGLPTRPSFDPTDNLSGIASQSDDWTVPTAPSGVGTYTYSATATDKAGNTTTETLTYKVDYSDAAFSGFLQPILAGGKGLFKLGSTIPVKFQLTCSGVPITNAVGKLYVKKSDSIADPGTLEPVSTAAATTGNLFRYDATGQQYIFNLSTRQSFTNPGATDPTSFSIGTWVLTVRFDDGVTLYSGIIQLVK